jgi:uncharacterized protein YdaU (DUF1376 family)
VSFAYFPFYTGDYYRDTRHLSMLQHGAYRQLLDHCWDQKGPIPLDAEKCYRICGAVSKEEQEAVRGVISEFFVRMEDGHYNKRVQQEIERAAALSGKRSGAAHERWKARDSLRDIASHNANAMQVHSKSNASAPSPSPSPSPSLYQHQDKNTGAPRAAPRPTVSAADLVAEGVDPQHAADWIKARGKVPLTITAWTAVKREAAAAGLTPAQAVKMAAEAQWRGFKAEWVHKGARRVDAVAAGNFAAVQRFKERHG